MYRMLEAVKAVEHLVTVDSRLVDWNLIRELVDALEDVARLTTEMQAEIYMMGDFFRDLMACRERLAGREETPSVTAMQSHLDKRSRDLLSTVTYAAAIVCDPRYNTINSTAIDPLQRDDAIVSTYLYIYVILILLCHPSNRFIIGFVNLVPNKLFHIYSSFQKFLCRKYLQLKRVEKGDYTLVEDSEWMDEPRTPRTPLPNPTKRSRPMTTQDNFFCFNTEAITNNREANGTLSMREKLEGLTLNPGCGQFGDTNVLSYWKDQKIDPELKKVIAMALSASASQVTIERAFSILSLILTDRNYNINSEYVENFALLKLNKVWYEKELKRLENVL